MTLRTAISAGIFAVLATAFLAVSTASSAHACGGYGDFLSEDTKVRRAVNFANYKQDRADIKAGNFARRHIVSVKRFGGGSVYHSARVVLSVAWNYERRSEVVNLVKGKNNRWVITSRYWVKKQRKVTSL